MAGVALLVVAAVAAVGWVWLRPAWQERSVAGDLRDVDGVARVTSPDDDGRGTAPRFRIELDDAADTRVLAAAGDEIRATVRGRKIGGDDVTAEVVLAGFDLEDALRRGLPEGMLRAVLALKDVDGLAGESAREDSIEMSVRSRPDVLPRGLDALRALSDAQVDGARATVLIRPSDDGGTALTASVAGAEQEAAVLSRVIDVVDQTNVELVGDGSGASISLFSGADGVDCIATVSLDQPARLRPVAESFASVGEACSIKLTASDGKASFTVATGREGVDRALALTDRLQGIGVSDIGVRSDLTSVSGSVADGEGLRGLERLTRDPAWTPSAGAALTIVWRGTDTYALADQTVEVLQRNGEGLARLRDAGFVASPADQTRRDDNPLVVTDDVEGAPRLADPEGRTSMIEAIRTSGLPGEIRFTIQDERDGDSLSFTSTSTGPARDITLPAGGVQSDGSGPTAWAEEFMAEWAATERR